MSKRMLFTWCLLSGIIIFLTPQHISEKFQAGFNSVFHWPLTISRNMMINVSAYKPVANQHDSNSIPDESLRADIVKLKNYNQNLLALNAQLSHKNNLLSNFRQSHPMDNIQLIYAQITKKTPKELIISLDDVAPIKIGQFVMANNCIIGQISNIWSHSAKVTLINNPSSQIPVIINEYNTMIKGTSSNQIKIPLLEKNKFQVEPGDAVFCKPQVGLLYSPIIIGYVSERKRDTKDPLMWDITVEPGCDLKTVTAVDVMAIDIKDIEE